MRVKTLRWVSLGLAALCGSWMWVDCAVGQQSSTAWKNGQFRVDVAGVVGRSDLVLGQPNLLPSQALPLGNGRLGLAVWSADGLTVQMNRVDTLPGRLSPGQLTIPGLTALTSAKDFAARLDLYNGTFEESGGGMTAKVYVQPDSDTLIVDVTGVDPDAVQTAQLKLWAPRKPKASAAARTGMLAESWMDDKDPGASGREFGSLAAMTAQGRNVVATVTDSWTVTISVLPEASGKFRIVVAAPRFDGNGSAAALVKPALLNTDAEKHSVWWNALWQRACLIKATSQDGSAEYMENLRTLYLFNSTASNGGEYPGSQAGVGDMFSAVKDVHHWASASFWHWNLRMQVAANMGAGLPELNAPYFRLYRENLASIQKWTRQHMAGRPGICIPETMRFNGPGIEYEMGEGWGPNTLGLDCAADSRPYYNARTISTGGEVSSWIWQQYLQTGDMSFLAANYPVMAESARFLLAYQKPGADGMDHTNPSNAHELQWDITDPVTDLVAKMSLFPATAEAAKLLGRDKTLQTQLRAAMVRIPPLPRVQKGSLTLLPAYAGRGTDVFASSYEPGAEQHNVENLGLEVVWPYGLIGDRSEMFDVAKRTYAARPYPTNQDWSSDPIQAARLGLGDEVGSTLVTLTKKYQTFANGFANWGGTFGEFYIEQQAVVADAMQEAIVQDYDGVIRIAPAIPPGWDFDGSVAVRGRTKIDVQIRNGVAETVVIESGSRQQLRLRNPWPGHAIDIVAASGAHLTTHAETGGEVTFSALAGAKYLIRQAADKGAGARFEEVSGTRATTARSLGPAQLGLPRAK